MTSTVEKESPGLFPLGLPAREWCQFAADGFSIPACGAIFRADRSPCCGVPLGGISTGCLDIDPRGVWGFSSIFNPSSKEMGGWDRRGPRKLPPLEPILGLSSGGKTWVLATEEMIAGGEMPWCTDLLAAEMHGKEIPQHFVDRVKLSGVEAATNIDYWGHYPVADMQFELSAPVTVGMRAWSPLIPGDTAASNIPAAVFEVRLRAAQATCSGTLVFNFPGPDHEEARSTDCTRTALREEVNGVIVSSAAGVNYVLGIIGEEAARFGGGLGGNADAWKSLATSLPQPAHRELNGIRLYNDASSAAAVDFDLEANEEKVVRFVLAWYAPEVEGAKKTWDGVDRVEDGFLRQRWLADPRSGNTNYYYQMYATRYSGAVDIARRVGAEHDSLLQRVLAWQEVIYGEDAYPVWLRDALVNNLALIAEDSHWFQPRPPLGDWAYPFGAFALNESPRGCPHMSCNPCDWYGNHPIVFFFPELSASTLRLFKQYQLDDGEIPFAIGKIGDLPDMATPEYYWQVSLNGTCYIDMVDRQWQRTGDETFLAEFYASVKECNTFTMNLNKNPGGVISMPEIGGMEWFEAGEWIGMVAHIGVMRLAQLKMMRRMALAVEDRQYADECARWLEDGTRAMEEQLWTGSYYLNFLVAESGKKSDDIMAFQLDGEWASRYHGCGGVLQADRIKTTLDTIKRTNVALTPEIGAAIFARPDGSALDADSKIAEYGVFAMFPPEVVLLGMNYIYAGDRAFGLDLIRRHWENLVLRQGHGWDLPNIVHGDSGKRAFGTDYYQNMILWALPAALQEQDLREFTARDGLIHRVLEAGKLSHS
jgi:uncharacterized protein (DUF608 family)